MVLGLYSAAATVLILRWHSRRATQAVAYGTEQDDSREGLVGGTESEGGGGGGGGGSPCVPSLCWEQLAGRRQGWQGSGRVRVGSDGTGGQGSLVGGQQQGPAVI